MDTPVPSLSGTELFSLQNSGPIFQSTKVIPLSHTSGSNAVDIKFDHRTSCL